MNKCPQKIRKAPYKPSSTPHTKMVVPIKTTSTPLSWAATSSVIVSSVLLQLTLPKKLSFIQRPKIDRRPFTTREWTGRSHLRASLREWEKVQRACVKRRIRRNSWEETRVGTIRWYLTQVYKMNSRAWLISDSNDSWSRATDNWTRDFSRGHKRNKPNSLYTCRNSTKTRIMYNSSKR